MKIQATTKHKTQKILSPLYTPPSQNGRLSFTMNSSTSCSVHCLAYPVHTHRFTLFLKIKLDEAIWAFFFSLSLFDVLT